MEHEPILNYNFPLDKAAEEGGWQQANRYSVWIGRQAESDPPYQVLERHPQGLVRLPLKPRLMRLIPAGTPFRIAHLFAPFRASDADMIYLRVAMEEGVYHTLLAATSREVKKDDLVWFCPGCGEEMRRATFDTGRHGLVAFWPFMLEEVRAFNAAPARQKCGACGAVHPPGYGFDAKLDLPAEAQARGEG
jgi:hypothetical protein